jgi:FdhE protein
MSGDTPGLPGDVVYLKLPRPAELFEGRARRLRELVPGNPMGDFLEALASVAEAQSRLVGRVPPAPVGTEIAITVPLCATTWARSPAWRDVLAGLVEDLLGREWPAPASHALRRLSSSGPEELEAMADGVLRGTPASADLAAAPFVGAALQVYFAALAAGLPADGLERSQGGCPVCDSPPVAGVVLGDDKLRYLCCSLCGSEWNLTRIQCWNCRNTGGIRFLEVAGDEGGLKAEACAACGAYLKLFYRDRMPSVEPMADDVASLTLDLLAAQDGWARSGVNLFLLGGGEG